MMCCILHPLYAAHLSQKSTSNDSIVLKILSSKAFISEPEKISEEKRLSDYANSWVYSWQTADEHWRKEIIGLTWGMPRLG